MATCGSCGKTILFGGKKLGERRYCSDACLASARVLDAASQIPETVVRQHAAAIFAGTCPKCKGEGPVDVHLSHSIWSALVMSSWKSTPHITCRKCGIKSQAIDAVSSMLLGWWGIPWGIVITPVQIAKNIGGMAASRPKADGPSPELIRLVRLGLASSASRQGPK